MRIVWNFLKYTLLIILLLIGAIIIGGDMGILNYFKKPISAVVKLSTGRNLTIGGDIRLKLIPFDKAHLIINDLHFANHKMAKNKDFLSYKKLQVNFSFADLLTRGYFNASKLELVDPVINFEKFSNGENSLSFGGKAKKEQKKAAIPHISILDGKITNANINILSGKESTKISNMNINMNIGSLLGPFDVKGSANFDGQNLLIKAKSGQIKDGKSNVDIEIKKGANIIVAKGDYDINKGNFNGDLKANAILREIGLKDINIDAAGITPNSAVKANISLSVNNANADNIKVNIQKLQANIGKQKLIGNASLIYNQSMPKLSGTLNLKELDIFYKIIESNVDDNDKNDENKDQNKEGDSMFNLKLIEKPKDSKGFSLNNYLSPYYENFDEGSKIPNKAFPWPDDEVNLVALSDFMNFDLKLNASRIRYNDIEINNSALTLKKEKDNFDARLNLNVMGAKNDIKANLKLSESGINGKIDINSHLKNIEKFTDNKLKGDLKLLTNIHLSGNNLRQIISNLDGNIKVNVDKAVLVGYDIGALLQSGGLVNLLTGGVVNLVSDLSNPVGLVSGAAGAINAVKGLSGETPFKHIIAEINIKNGVANIEKAAAIAKPIKIMVEKGSINLKNAGLDLFAKVELPGLNKDAKTRARLNGPFKEIEIGLHKESAKKVADMLTDSSLNSSKNPLGIIGKVANPLNATPVGIIGNVIGGAVPKAAPAGKAAENIGSLGKLLGGL